MKLPQLRAALIAKVLSSGGTKQELMLRLENAIAEERASGAAFVIPAELFDVAATLHAVDLMPFPAIARRVLCKIVIDLAAAAESTTGSPSQHRAREVDWAKHLHSFAGFGTLKRDRGKTLSDFAVTLVTNTPVCRRRSPVQPAF